MLTRRKERSPTRSAEIVASWDSSSSAGTDTPPTRGGLQIPELRGGTETRTPNLGPSDGADYRARPSLRRLVSDKRGEANILEFAIIGLISIFVVALFAANILPTLFNQTMSMSTNADLSTGDQALVLIFNTLAVVAYILIPVALVFTIVALMRRSKARD